MAVFGGGAKRIPAYLAVGSCVLLALVLYQQKLALVLYQQNTTGSTMSAAPTTCLPSTQPKAKIHMIYQDLSHCPSRPEYFPEYKAHCWGICKKGNVCSSPVSQENVRSKRARLLCIGNVNLAGVRKSGTTDFSKWLLANKDIHYNIKDFNLGQGVCPVEWFANRRLYYQHDEKYNVQSLKTGFFQKSAGNLIISGKVSRNSTHIVIATPMQFIGFMATPDTRIYVQLRNPTDRTISYLFHFHRLRRVPELKGKNADAAFVDHLIGKYLSKVKACIAEYGDFYCTHISKGNDGDMDSLIPHSMYVVYIKEAFKFISRSQFQFNTTDEYAKDPENFARKFTQKHFGAGFPQWKFDNKDDMLKAAKKPEVWKSTLQLLDRFYEPYNRQLAELLGDDKWLFPVNRDS